MHFSTLLGLLATAGSTLAAPSVLAGRAVQESWAGAILDGKGFTAAKGTFKVPSISGQGKKAASVWVGIDGSSCKGAIIQTGVNLHGDGTIFPWTEWYPGKVMAYENPITVSAGDELRMSVKITSTTSGTTTLENLTTDKTATHEYTGQHELCQTNAEWIIENYGSPGSRPELLDFGDITIYDNSATSSSGTSDASGARLSNLKIDQKTRSKCSTSASGVECSYVAA
ncbi:hypothetical protein K4F52_009204 [Lecanicillium sp. MT-2017a]|nr:hypothetical protein K4F52_009204 [Lecanicillium sp. MT-2017a]